MEHDAALVVRTGDQGVAVRRERLAQPSAHGMQPVRAILKVSKRESHRFQPSCLGYRIQKKRAVSGFRSTTTVFLS
jgi:hypothetical protein